MEVLNDFSPLYEFFHQTFSGTAGYTKLKQNQTSSLLSALFETDIQVLSMSKSHKNVFLCSSHHQVSNDEIFVVHISSVKYHDIKDYQKRIKFLVGLSDKFIKPDSFAFGFNNNWILAEKFLPYTSVSLDNYLKTKNLRKYEMLEFLVKLILKLIENFQSLSYFELEIISLDPANVIILFSSYSKNNFDVKFGISKNSSFPKKILKSDEVSQEKFKRLSKRASISLGSLIFYCLNFKKSKNFVNFLNLPFSKIKEKVQGIKAICGITNLFNYLKKRSPKDLQTSSKILTWRYILGFDNFPPSSYSISALFTVFYFRSKGVHEKTLEILTSNLRFIMYLKPQYFYSSLLKNFSNSLALRKVYSSEINQVIFNFITQILLKQKAKQLSAIFPLLFKVLESNLNIADPYIIQNLELIVKRIKKFPTFSIVKLLIKTERLQQIYKKNPKKHAEVFLNFAYFIDKTDEECFTQTVFMLKKTWTKEYTFLLLKFFRMIPIHIKLQFSYQILTFLDDFLITYEHILEWLSFKENLTQRMIIFDIFYEMLVASKNSFNQNKLGQCYENFYCFRGTSLMIMCLSCKKTLCIVCGKGHSDLNHSIKYLSHFRLEDSQRFHCQTEEKSGKTLPHCTHGMHPPYDKFPVHNLRPQGNDFLLTGDKFKFNFSSSQETFICYYTEIEFFYLSSEDFSIIFPESKIEVNNFTETCRRDESFICKIPKIGSGDTFGFGFTSDKFLFFTFNGINILQYMKLSSTQVTVGLRFRNHPKTPILKNPSQALYTTEAFIFPEKMSILSFPHILKSLTLLYNSRKLPEAVEDQAVKILLLKSLYKAEDFSSFNEKTVVQNEEDPFLPNN